MYFYNEITVTVKGTAWRRVHCEKCEKVYFYKMTRVFSAEEHSPFMLGDIAATERARKKAEKALNRSLKKSHDPVPCPHCGSFQAAMRKPFAEQCCEGMMPLAIILLGASGLLFFVWSITASSNRRGDGPLGFLFDYQGWLLAAWLSPFVIGCGIAVWRESRLARLDPNTYYSEEQRRQLAKEHALTEEEFRAAEALSDSPERPWNAKPSTGEDGW